ncbi:hypothetical protein HS141_12245 [Cetobacterium somerae]|uniref:Chemotaxis protein n=1 Tax=Cetobacterium somerae ATCC BAA-474 TaxID=1319815 RepID=U7V8V7_9FUSO|nr:MULTISPECIES: hypothetical protein [Cetobacterium]ERT67946.1 hypothetical protein HMPREF0202_02164 [Cetobacterium somerae ATCC BAA-474]MBC2854076.1 hypothetical protein [Cetobacterium sp. 2G large]MCQ9627695.1 hypothetical protein [Cetobacterium somerae]
MEIFINGEKINIGIKNTKLLNVLEKLEANVIQNGEVIVELKLDGEMVDGKSLPLNKKVKILELTTRSHREILIESLYLLEPYSDRFFENLSEVEEEMNDIGKIIEMVSFVEWVFGIVLSLKEATAIDLLYSDYNEYVEEFKKYAEEIFEAFKKEDFVGIIELLEGAIVPLLEDLLANSKDYLKEVLKEEGRRKLLN